MMMGDKELPRYQCHKKVHALRIKVLERHEGGGVRITPQEPGYEPFWISSGWIERFKPEGSDLGVLVIYGDGYASWSPTSVFDAGYTLDVPGQGAAEPQGFSERIAAGLADLEANEKPEA